jgi:acetyltransferase-like isoleucine patch superfamily enzyme
LNSPIIKEIGYQLRWGLPIWFLGLLSNWWPNNRITNRIRGLLHKPFIKKCGHNFQMASWVTLRDTQNIEIGNDVYIAYYAWINGLGGITIEDQVTIGPYVTISSVSHVYKNGSYRFGGSRSAPVKIKSGSWIAAHVSIALGVTVGSGCLVAANSAVTKDIPDGMMVGGVPAKVIGPCIEDRPDITSRSGW